MDQALPRADEARRLGHLHALQTPDGAPDPALDALVRCAAQLCGGAVALLCVADAERLRFVSRVGLAQHEAPRQGAPCGAVLRSGAPLHVPDLQADPRFAAWPLVSGVPHLRAYAGVPIVVDGLALGSLCVMDTQPRTLAAAQREGLADLALAAQQLIERRRHVPPPSAPQWEMRDRQTFETLQNLARHVPGVIYQFERRADGSASFPYASEGLRRVFELSPEQVLHDAAPWFERIHPEDRDAVQRAIATSAAGAQAWSQTWRVLLPAQGLRVLDNVASPNTRPDGAVMWHGFVTDVTEQQKVAAELTRSGEQWALASQAASIGIFEFDPSASTVRLDQHACALHGLPVPENGAAGATLVFAQWLDLLNADSRETAKAYLATVSAASVAQREVLLATPPGREPRNLEFVVRALPGTARHSARVLMGVCRDVTEQVAVDLLHQQVNDAQQASRSKTEFLSRVSHELRTPLNGILGFAQLLESDPTEPLSHTQLQRVQTIRMSGRRLLSLVNDVLELSKIEQKTFSFQLESVALADVVDNCIAMVQPLALDRVVQLQVDASLDKVFVKADRRALDQILLNLLSNAIKYNRHGGHVRISAELKGVKGRGRVRLMLQDSGLGMTAQQTENLFQPFNRVGAEHTRIEGTGLGLVIARELALGLGGALEVSSVPGRGSCFTVTLPAARASTRLATAPMPEVQQTDWVAAIGASALYIEDDPVNMALMEAIFAQLGGWQLWTATTGGEGLALALQHRPALVLTDMNLPDMTGLEIVRQLRRDPQTSGMRIVAVSADAMPDQLALFKANGVDDYWTKPLDVQLIRRRLNSFLSGDPDGWTAERGLTVTTASGNETLGD